MKGIGGRCAAVVLAAALPQASAWAQDYPVKPVRVVVGFVPGGTTDTTARVLAAKLAEGFGQQFIVENRPGAASNVAAELVAKAPPDGYTLMVLTVSQTVNATLYKKLPFDIRTDIAPVSLLVTAPHLLVVHPSIPVKTVGDLVAFVRARPGQLNFANAGNGSSAHLATALFAATAKLDVIHVPYKGAAGAVTDLLAGQTHAMFSDMIVARAHVLSGRLRALAVTMRSGSRSALMPELPTVADSGLPGFESGTWVAAGAPGATPRPIIDRLHGEIVKGFRAADTRERMAGLGMEIIAGTPEALGATIRADVEKWGRIVRATGITAN